MDFFNVLSFQRYLDMLFERKDDYFEAEKLAMAVVKLQIRYYMVLLLDA